MKFAQLLAIVADEPVFETRSALRLPTRGVGSWPVGFCRRAGKGAAGPLGMNFAKGLNFGATTIVASEILGPVY